MKLGAAVSSLQLLVASQFVLPLSPRRACASELNGHGERHVGDVSAFPALKLLVERADSVRVRMSRARIGTGDLADRLASTTPHAIDSTSASTRSPSARCRCATCSCSKDGDALAGEASLTRADLAAALPVDLGLRPVASEDGALVMEADVGPVSVRARLSASDGSAAIAPDGLLGGFAALTVFEDPRVRRASPSAPSRAPTGSPSSRGRGFRGEFAPPRAELRQ